MQICFKTGCIVGLNFPSNLFTFLHSYHPGGVPFFQVFPGILQCLPLKEDFDENHPVYSCIIELFSDQHTLIRQFLPQLLAVFSQVLPSGTLQEGIRAGLISMVQSVQHQSPQRFQNILAEMPPEHAQVLVTAVSLQAPG